MNLFEYSNIVEISDLVKQHFPQFYWEDGPAFVEFIKAYYEWLQDPENPVGQARSRYKQFDIDTASAKFLEHYREKYMWGLPPDILGNQRLLQKHILELYRAKGSQSAIRLLFRLLFNEDIEFYIPSYDIFKLSDNTWNEPHYIEITYTDQIDKFHGQAITGSTSGATAVVESYQSRIVNGRHSYLLYISNIEGTFVPSEVVLVNGIDPLDAPIIKGSVVGVDIQSSTPGFSIGDTVVSSSGQLPVKIVVSGTYAGQGTLDFQVVQPGTYYTLDAVFYTDAPVHLDQLEPVVYEDIDADEYGFPKNPSANLSSKIKNSLYLPGIDNVIDSEIPITGSGAAIKIKTLKDTFPYTLYVDNLIDYINVDLDGLYPFPKLPTSNVNTIIVDSLLIQTIIVGSIDTIEVLNPGIDYTTEIYFYPVDTHTGNNGILDANGVQVGTNGLIIGYPQVGTSIVNQAKVVASGIDNIQFDTNIFIDDANTGMRITATPVIGGVGWAEGYFENTKSFLSDDKYLFDGHYYQNFSYVIRASITLDKYIEILKQIAHPAGNAVYGDVKIKMFNHLDHRITDLEVDSRSILENSDYVIGETTTADIEVLNTVSLDGIRYIDFKISTEDSEQKVAEFMIPEWAGVDNVVQGDNVTARITIQKLSGSVAWATTTVFEIGSANDYIDHHEELINIDNQMRTFTNQHQIADSDCAKSCYQVNIGIDGPEETILRIHFYDLKVN